MVPRDVARKYNISRCHIQQFVAVVPVSLGNDIGGHGDHSCVVGEPGGRLAEIMSVAATVGGFH